MKNVLGKIFVFAIFVMSLMLMSFAVAIYSSHVNWQEVAKKKQEDLDKLKAEETSLNQEITRLTANVATSEAARDQVIAKFQQALIEKDKELRTLKDARDDKLTEMQKKIADLATVEADLTRAREEVTKLQAEVRDKQQKVDSQVTRAAEIAGQLHEKESFLEIANERKSQLEKQVAQARLLLKQSGPALNGQSAPTANDTNILLGRLDLKLFAGAEADNAKAAVRLASDMGEFFMPFPGTRMNQQSGTLQAGPMPGSSASYDVKFSDASKPNAVGDGDGHLADHLAGADAHQVCAEHFVGLCVREDFHEAVGLVIGLGASWKLVSRPEGPWSPASQACHL
jgi:uncharacterized protein YlxW (UPF0749 family)